MTGRRIIFILTLIWAVMGAAAAQSSPPAATLTLPEYVSELDHLLAATADLEANPENGDKLANVLPARWSVVTDTKTFDLSTESIKSDLHSCSRQDKAPDLKKLAELRSRLQYMRSEAAGFLQPAEDLSPERARANDILARREFRRVQGPTWWDQLQRRITEALLDLLSRLFGASAFPKVAKGFVWALIAAAVLALAIWIYRILKRGTQLESISPGPLPVSAKQWPVWLAEARAAADRGAWRDAVHLAYWAGISFLEERGSWRPDRARTPREYLRLLPQESEQRPTLATLTRQFETVWYGYREAGPEVFSETVAHLEKLGCR